jgi:hypothetical protein
VYERRVTSGLKVCRPETKCRGSQRAVQEVPAVVRRTCSRLDCMTPAPRTRVAALQRPLSGDMRSQYCLSAARPRYLNPASSGSAFWGIRRVYSEFRVGRPITSHVPRLVDGPRLSAAIKGDLRLAIQSRARPSLVSACPCKAATRLGAVGCVGMHPRWSA